MDRPPQPSHWPNIRSNPPCQARIPKKNSPFVFVYFQVFSSRCVPRVRRLVSVSKPLDFFGDVVRQFLLGDGFANLDAEYRCLVGSTFGNEDLTSASSEQKRGGLQAVRFAGYGLVVVVCELGRFLTNFQRCLFAR